MSWAIDDDDIDKGGELAEEGPHPGVRIGYAVLKRSASGAQMVNLALVNSENRVLAFDNIMMEGKGLNIGLKKLKTIGLAHRNDDDTGWKIPDVEEWNQAMPFTVYLKHEVFNSKTSAKPDFNATEAFGYESEGDMPESAQDRSGEVDDDIPF